MNSSFAKPIKTLLPQNTILGILGGGQLGRMLTFVAKRYGYKVSILSDKENSPAGQVADREFVGDYQDTALLTAFGKEVDVVTYEFENIPLFTCEFLEQFCEVHPNKNLLSKCQNRLRERELLTSLDIPVAHHQEISAEKNDIKENFPFPAILKTASSGYDGKGQRVVPSQDKFNAAWKELKNSDCILEEKISFSKEFSIIISQDKFKNSHTFGPIENTHENHILSVSRYPGDIPEESIRSAKKHLTEIAKSIELVGVLTAEFFLLKNGEVIVNELAPRPHNSGHLTIEACHISQFEAQLRAVCGLPLLPFVKKENTSAQNSNNSSRQYSHQYSHRHAAMLNLIGEKVYSNAIPYSEILQLEQTSLHLYGKEHALKGRKMGHITTLSYSDKELEEKIALITTMLLGN